MFKRTLLIGCLSFMAFSNLASAESDPKKWPVVRESFFGDRPMADAPFISFTAPRRAESGAQVPLEMMVDQSPDRLVFGTNWPNPALFTPQQMPDDGNTIDVFCGWIKDENTRKLILVDNPAQLYGFN